MEGNVCMREQNSGDTPMLPQRFARLNALAAINSARRYLEVGVSRGGTFFRVNVAHKVAVDPKFRFDVEASKTENALFHEVTSDEFFAKIAPDYDPFDLIYLDGLHTFDQTFRDFCWSLRYAHAKTIWLIDDTNPISLFAADRDQHRAARLRRIEGDTRSHWMGDVFKTVFAIHDFFPQFSYATFPGHGQTVVWGKPRQDFVPHWNSLEAIARLRYDDFIEAREPFLNILEPDAIIDQISKSFPAN